LSQAAYTDTAVNAISPPVTTSAAAMLPARLTIQSSYDTAASSVTLHQHAAPPTELEHARREFDLRNSAGQLIGHAAVRTAAHSVSTVLAEMFGRVMRFEANLAEVRYEQIADDNEQQKLLDEIDGPVAEELRRLRTIMREDLGMADD
jgi:hypothetical protein